MSAEASSDCERVIEVGPAPAVGSDAGRPDAHSRRILDVLGDCEGPVKVDDLARRLAKSGSAPDRWEEVERQLLARAIPALLDRGAIAFSPEEWTVSLPADESAPNRRRLVLGVGSAGIAASATVTGAGLGWSTLVLVAAAGVLLLSLEVLARRRSRRPDRSTSPVRSLEPGDATHPATVTVADRGPDRRIFGLLLAVGGRLHQQAIVAELGLSESTVSRHLASLADAGHLAKVSVGRENLVCLPRARPAEAATGRREPLAPGGDTGD